MDLYIKKVHNDVHIIIFCMVYVLYKILIQGKCMFNNKKSYLLAVFAITFSMFNTNVVAQDEAADDNVEDVIVTGTRLKSDGFEAVSPVAVVTADNIKKTGLVRIEDVLNQMPQLETADSSFEPSGETGTASLDLRGLGSQRTLILLNGKRMQPGSIWSEDSDIGQI